MWFPYVNWESGREDDDDDEDDDEDVEDVDDVDVDDGDDVDGGADNGEMCWLVAEKKLPRAFMAVRRNGARATCSLISVASSEAVGGLEVQDHSAVLPAQNRMAH